MNAAAMSPKLTLRDHADTVGTLAKGTVPLFKSGVLGPMTPMAAGKALQSMYQWRFLPAGLLSIGAARDPFHTAIIDDAGSMTYSELHEQTNTLARALFRSGVRERDKIGVLCRNHRGLILTLCAHGRLGTDIVFFNTGSSAEQTRAVLTEQKVDVMFIDEEFLPLLPKDFNGAHVIVAWEFGDTLGLSREAEAAQKPQSNVRDAIDSGDYATRSNEWASLHEVLRTTPEDLTVPSRPRMGRTIILTSGTTGTPKGARRPEPKTYMPASSIMSRIPLKHHRPAFLAAPMFHTWGFAQIQLALALRNTMILQRKFTPEAAVQVIEKNRPYTIAMVPTMLRRMLDAVPEGFNPGTKIIATSGEALPPAVIEETQKKFGDVLYNLYGSTEVSWASIATPEELRRFPKTAGRPPMATTLKILDNDGKEVPAGETGRIFVKNDMLFEGYTRPGSDKDVVDGMVATGDLGYYNEEGLLFIAGRSDDMIVSGGENVYPQDTENIFTSREEIEEAAVRGVDCPMYGQALCAWVVFKDKKAVELTDEEKRSFEQGVIAEVKQKLARHAVPRYFVYLDELPRNPVGKVVPRELPQPDTGA
ncbi:AMP-binding protein [Corynebacterium auriscanis]|uniref:Acyl-CoA synthetase n=1 Tax=Corynebacterium auriscanis TaxID=99807 RepID=A0A0A2DKZ5_9CORY|nr:AMP-binding protein [Corynebacterium auriscanis]KGM18604.1 acyl-CoA synthetase [Corynebacterium auriscanis]WJY72082.1 Long-chain-fatty-acid--CoA ligase [Corynebacterium auriscanis]